MWKSLPVATMHPKCKVYTWDAKYSALKQSILNVQKFKKFFPDIYPIKSISNTELTNVFQNLDPYVAGEVDTVCPSDLVIITTEQECRDAIESIYGANSIEIVWTDKNEGSVPRGCSYRTSDKKFHFNNGALTAGCCSSRNDLAPICKSDGICYIWCL